MNNFLKSGTLAIVVLIAVTIPTIVHTKSLILKITVVEGPDWLLQLYAWFFALAFDASIFMFAIYEKKAQAVAFAIMSGLIGWMFWNADLVFVDWWLPNANTPQLASRLLIGTLISAFQAYLVYYCSELIAVRVRKAPTRRGAAGRSQPVAETRPKEIISPRGGPPRVGNPRRELVATLLDAGKPVSEIIAETGLSRSTVYEYKKQLTL